MVFGIDIEFLITDAVNRNGHAEETMTSFRMTATIHSHVDSDCRRDEGVGDESHLSRVPRLPVVIDVIQEDALGEPNTAIDLPPEGCLHVDEGELVYLIYP